MSHKVNRSSFQKNSFFVAVVHFYIYPFLLKIDGSSHFDMPPRVMFMHLLESDPVVQSGYP